MLRVVSFFKQGLLHSREVSLGTGNLRLWCLVNQGLHSTSINFTFFERDPKGGYNKDKPKPSHLEVIKKGFQQIKDEIKLWKEDVVEAFEGDFLLSFQPGEVDKKWVFQEQKDLDKWVTTSDIDHSEGTSTCQLSINKAGRGLFSGNLCTDVPKDGKHKRTGYCNMRSIRARKSFKRDSHYDWGMYSHLVMRVRGDGRRYMLHISTSSYFDQTWNDAFTYILFTRGGPYWQVAKIPFSKFFFTSKGRIQDRQGSVILHKVSNFGITVADKNNGPFALEIDYIGLEYDPSYNEKFAYEMYKSDLIAPS